jgi:hypothetical protein
LVGAGDRKTGPKAPGQTSINVAGKNAKEQTQTGKPGNLDIEIPCPEDATSFSNNFISVKTKTENGSTDRNTDPYNIQNTKPGQLKSFVNLIGENPNTNDQKNAKNPNAANQTGAPNANSNPITNVDAKKPDQGKRPTSTQPKAAKPKPDMISRLSNIRNATKLNPNKDSSLSPIANLVSEMSCKSPAKTPDSPSKSRNQNPVNEKDDILRLESNPNSLDHCDDGKNLEDSLRIIEKIRDTPTYGTQSGPMMDIIK